MSFRGVLFTLALFFTIGPAALHAQQEFPIAHL